MWNNVVVLPRVTRIVEEVETGYLRMAWMKEWMDDINTNRNF